MAEKLSQVPAQEQLGDETEAELIRREGQAAIADQFVHMRDTGTPPGLIRRALEWIASGFRNSPKEK